MNAKIKLSNVNVTFPVHNASSLSFKNHILKKLTGGSISRSHDGVTLVKSLKDINLEISSGERIGLVGHNGAGKTTLLRVLSGIYKPTHGDIKIDGQCTSLINISLGIDPEATGRENIKIRATMMGLKPEEIEKKIEDIIEFTGLGNFIHLPFRTYSTGMQLRLAFAVSTAIKPQILIMDEWLSTGDENFKEKAEIRLKDVVESAEILILASHSKELLSTICSRIIWLEQGEIKMDGTVESVTSQYFKN